MGRLPALDIKTHANHSPHVVLLGAGASVAALPRGDKNGRPLPVLGNLVDIIGLRELVLSHGVDPAPPGGFEALYDALTGDVKFDTLRSELESRVREYFTEIEIPTEVTLYDRLLTCLRPKDLVATFNWDPLLLQAYARNRSLRELPRIVFLHGNVNLGFCEEHRVKGYSTQRCEVCDSLLQPSPLLFPVKDKRYKDHAFLQGEWSELEHTLEHAYLLTIIGYSAPTSDAAAKELLHAAWTKNESNDLAEIGIVDIVGRRELQRRWKDFIVRSHFGTTRFASRTLLSRFPRRSCEAFAYATLQQRPWVARPLPRYRRLSRLHAWIEPLVQEELAMASGRPLEIWRHSP